MNKKNDLAYEWLYEMWKPLLLRNLNKSSIMGLDRDDLHQEIQLVLWECFVKADVQHFPTYLSRSIHNRITDLYAESRKFYFPSTRLKCAGCGLIVSCKPKHCPSCAGKRWKETKGYLTTSLVEDIPIYENYEGVTPEEYPREIRDIVNNILAGRKTGHKQKDKVREYLRQWEQLAEV